MSEQEKNQTPKETVKSPGFGDVFDGMQPVEESREVMVGSGVYLERLPVGGMTVMQVREKYSDRMDIDENADAFIDGKKATEEMVLSRGQVLRFAHKAGEKG